MNLTDDRYQAMALIEPFCRTPDYAVAVIDGEPPSKARARFTSKGKPYTPRVTVEGEKRLADRFDSLPTFEGNVVVGCIFYRSTRQRVDIDNLFKAVLDAGTRASMWEDDSQVTALLGVIEHDHDNPRAVVAFGNHASSLTRGHDALRPCEACGKLFFQGGTYRREKGRWCSRECRMTLAVPVPCPTCGEPFKRRSGNHKFCSVACRGVAQTKRFAARTHCNRGHELTPENTRRMADGRRRCLRCQAENARTYRERKNASLTLEAGLGKERTA